MSSDTHLGSPAEDIATNSSTAEAAQALLQEAQEAPGAGDVASAASEHAESSAVSNSNSGATMATVQPTEEPSVAASQDSASPTTQDSNTPVQADQLHEPADNAASDTATVGDASAAAEATAAAAPSAEHAEGPSSTPNAEAPASGTSGAAPSRVDTLPVHHSAGDTQLSTPGQNLPADEPGLQEPLEAAAQAEPVDAAAADSSSFQYVSGPEAPAAEEAQHEAPAAAIAIAAAAATEGSELITTTAEAGAALEPQQAAAASQQAASAAVDQSSGTQHDTAAVAGSSSGTCNSRQPDKAYFVDGVRAIDVEVDCGPGLPCKLLHVTVDVSAPQHSNKPYLGGYRHKQTGALFHHASIQTPHDQTPSKKGHKQHPPAAVSVVGPHEQPDVCCLGVRLSRETQTVEVTSCSSQTVREAATQMAAPGLLLDCSGDRVLTPRPYVPSEVVAQQREAAALTIQRFSRGWLARKRAAVLQGIKAERDAFLAETAAESAQAALEHKQREVARRTHPLSKADFALLESELETWRQQQTAAIKAAGLDPREEQAALQLLLAKETRLLHTLDRLRVAAHQERRAVGRQQQLGGLAQPKTWSLSNGKKVLVHTPLTVRAAELQQLYRGLALGNLSLDERLDVLLHVKWVAKEYDCSTTRELVELIDREADLLNRGWSPKTQDGLRRRIAGLFLTCCQNPAFNPEAARLRVNAVGPNGPEGFEYSG